jgi:1-acyl-sn-glycerol-3-phosphate acyltransferase
MGERLERAWRVLATGLCFAAFGIGSLLLGVLVFPLLHLLAWSPERRVRAARRVIRATFGFFIGLMRATGVLTVEVRGAERLQGGGRLILANHPTLIDVVLLMSLVERCDCIVKGALGRNLITRGPVRAAGFVFNDDGEGLLEDCLRSLRAGSNLVIVPEGTRSPRTGPIQLQPLAKGEKWYRVPATRPHFIVQVGETIAVSPFIAGAAHPALAARHLNQHLTEYFARGHELASA